MKAIGRYFVNLYYKFIIFNKKIGVGFYNLFARIANSANRHKKSNDEKRSERILLMVDENTRKIVERPKSRYRRRTRLEKKINGLLNFSDYKKPRFKVLYGFILFILIFTVMVAIVPVIWLFITSFKTMTEITSTHYHLFPEIFDITKIAKVWQKINFGRMFLNSLVVTLGAMFCAVFFNGIMAYVITIVKPTGYKIINGLIMISYMIPAVTAMVPLFKNLVALNMTNSVTAYLPLMLIFGANGFYYINFKNYFKTIPNSLFEAAKLEGCNNFQIFTKVVVPLSKPIMSVVAIFAMTAAWSDFLLPYLVIQDSEMYTVMVAVYNLSTTIGSDLTYDEFLMMLILSIIPQIFIFLIFQKQIMNTKATSGLKE